MPNPSLLITAVVREGRTQAEVARCYGVSQAWLSELLTRYRTEGEAAFELRSRRPASSPSVTPAATVELIVRLRTQLTEAGHDAGADTIAWHLHHEHGIAVSRSTIWRQLRTAGLITPHPPQPRLEAQAVYPRLTAGTEGDLIATTTAVWIRQPAGFLLRLKPATGQVEARYDINPVPSGGSLLATDHAIWTSAFNDATIYKIDLNAN